MKRFGLLTVGLASVLTACVGEGYVSSSTTPVYPTTVAQRPRWQDPAFFAQRVRQRMERIEARVRADVSEGLLDTRAIDEVIQRRQQVEGTLAQIGQAGFVTEGERDAVRNMIRETATIRQRYVVGANGAYGGGPPTYMPPEFRDDWWY